jgi:hypothetical protein
MDYDTRAVEGLVSAVVRMVGCGFIVLSTEMITTLTSQVQVYGCAMPTEFSVRLGIKVKVKVK